MKPIPNLCKTTKQLEPNKKRRTEKILGMKKKDLQVSIYQLQLTAEIGYDGQKVVED